MNQALTSAVPHTLSVGTFDAYINTISQLPLLEQTREQELARRFREQGDLSAARELVMANLRFVVHLARGYSGYGLPLPDLIQEGNIGLMKAVKRFDPDMGVRLVSFAVHWIRAEIHEFIIKNWRIVKIATTKAQRKLFFNLRKSKKHLGWLSKNEAENLAKDLKVDLKTVYEMEQRLDSVDLGLDNGQGEDANSTPAPIHYLEQQNADPAELLEQNQWNDHEHQQLHQALSTLDARSLDILKCRWLSEQKATLHELAERYAVSPERIRQLEQKALKKLKQGITLAA
ncbi:MAG: RNA polymerase sigma factor RpoH [Methylococcales bacterium]|nr:RNA polymerase sigma factor RpoH [Methylococcales bacterium]